MPNIQAEELGTIKNALMLSEGWDTALEIIKKLEGLAATDAEITAARAAHGSDDIEIDDDAGTSPGSEHGTWVQAWVFVYFPNCTDCGGTGKGRFEDCAVCDGSGNGEIK